MLDRRTGLLLNKINELCDGGSYMIVEESELLSCFPERYGVDGDGLAQMLRHLEERRMVDIKYSDGGVYCLCPLPDGRLYFENEKKERGDVFRRRRDTVLLTVLGAFLGAFIGSVTVWLMITYLLP